MQSTEILQRRIANQQLSYQTNNNPVSVLSNLGAIQGQDYTGAKWSLGIRCPNSTDQQVEEALFSKKIVRTWLMRGTLHLVTAKNVAWIQSLLSPRIVKGMAFRYRQLELEEHTLFRSNDILVKSLLEKNQLSRTSLLSILEQNGISTEGQRAAHLLQRASLDGLICQTHSTRNIPNFILLDGLSSFPAKLNREESLAALVKLYFTSRGPATLQDFIWWSGVTLSEAKLGIEGAKSELTEEREGDQIFWMPNHPLHHEKKEPKVLLMPGFDEFLLGYKNREFSLNAKFANRWCPGNNGMFMPFVLAEGQAIGIWKRIIKKERLQIEFYPFQTFNKKWKTSFEMAVDQYAKYMGTPNFEIHVTNNTAALES